MDDRPQIPTYSNPYLAGAFLGVVLTAAFVTLGTGLGALDAFHLTMENPLKVGGLGLKEQVVERLVADVLDPPHAGAQVGFGLIVVGLLAA